MFYYPFNIGDYISHTQHLTDIEDLAYRRMIDWCYIHERGLPESTEEVARLIRLRNNADCVSSVLQEFFKLDEGMWIQERIVSEIAKFHEKGEKAKLSAERRWNKDATAMPPHSECNAKQETITNNHKPINKYKPEIEFEEFWAIYPKHTGKAAAEKVWLKIKINTETFQLIVIHLSKAYLTTEKQFIPNPSTYLNQQRWNDEVIEQPVNNRVVATQPPSQVSFIEKHTNRKWADGLDFT